MFDLDIHLVGGGFKDSFILLYVIFTTENWGKWSTDELTIR